MSLDTDLTPFTKINTKWITGLNVKCEAIRLLEGNIGGSVDDLGYGDDVFGITPKTQSMKDRIEERTSLKLKTLLCERQYQEN